MNDLLIKAEKWLTELGVRTQKNGNSLWVSRDDIENLCGIGVVYDSFLIELRNALETNKFYWGGKDDEWLYLETF